MSILYTFSQAKEALKQLTDGTAYRRAEATAPLSEDFRAMLERDVVPLLAPIEQFRLEQLERKNRRKTLFKRLGWLLWLPTVVLDLYTLVSGDFPLYTLFVLAGFAVWVFYPAFVYTRHYKEKLMPVLVRAFGEFGYDKDGCIDLAAVEPFDILPSFSRKSSEDLIQGRVEDVQFEFCELKLERRGNKSNISVHRGGALLITMPFEFHGYTVVRADHGRLANLLSAPMTKDRVALENPEFEDRYEVRSSDQQYARYILSPAMMEHIIALDDLFRARAKGSGLTCEFRGNKALFMLSYFDNLLESADINVSAYDLDKMPLVEQELAMITGIIRQLKLDSMAARNLAYDRLG
ncbi:DUF3137 domain-containing protein [Marinobacter zhejiangensis]|uniref:DUF3137 domain-containing protein n=1 Tax=Marinobacter zhejiangensis TaxID=488535 RepID=A0A1I4Q1C9_9GAMM|nr:DUF3137 domain-containing protein [Marinobacter zhejiangensis]SFM33470.1 Protein of unknown function [Marinobacter zhejiangensis]